MPTNRREKQRFRGTIKEVNYRDKCLSAFDDLKIDTGKKYGKSRDGIQCWSTLKLKVPHPTTEHPLNIHLQLYNPNGDVLTVLSFDEFDEIIDSILEWYANHSEEIEELKRQDSIKQRNKQYLSKIQSILEDHTYSEPPELILDGINVTEKSIQREKELIMTEISNLKNSSNRSWLLKDILSKLDNLVSQNVDIFDIQEFLSKELIDDIH